MISSRGRDDGAARGRDDDAVTPSDLAYWRHGPKGPVAPEADPDEARWLRPLLLLMSAMVGLAVCIAGIVVHRHVDAHVPWGVVLALATAFAATRAAGILAGTAGAVLVAVPYALVLLLTMSSRPEGDYLVAADALGYTFLLGSLVALVAGVGLTVRDPRHTLVDAVGSPRTLDP